MINKVILTGRLVADVELRYTPSNKAVATARIASPVISKIKTGSERQTYFSSNLGQKAENFANWLKKGIL